MRSEPNAFRPPARRTSQQHAHGGVKKKTDCGFAPGTVAFFHDELLACETHRSDKLLDRSGSAKLALRPQVSLCASTAHRLQPCCRHFILPAQC